MTQNSQFNKWLESHRTKSTSRRYASALVHFCKHFNVKPHQTLKWNIDDIEDNIRDYLIYGRDKRKLKPYSLRFHQTALTSWFRFNKVRNLQLNTRSVIPRITKKPRYIPTKKDLKYILDVSPLRTKVFIGLMAYSGLRPVDIGSLQYKHIQESFENNNEIITIIKVQQKTSQHVITFLGYEGTRYLRNYLRGRKLKPNDYLFIRGKATETLIENAADRVRKAIDCSLKNSIGKSKGQRAVYPYTLRSYFRRQLQISGMDTVVAESLMGHQVDLSATYNGLADLDPLSIESLKQEYLKALPELETELSENYT
ncbi:MAG: tyrosine-type recombinase/integrase, partial [Candidatus Thorarchaeota archaeon]